MTATTGEHRVVMPRDPTVDVDRICAMIVQAAEALRRAGGNSPLPFGVGHSVRDTALGLPRDQR